MSYAGWIRGQHKIRDTFRPTDPEEAMRRARQFLGLEPHREDAIAIWPNDRFHRYCPQHNERLNWLLCPKGHELGGTDVWVVKDEETGEVIDVCRDNDGTGQWTGLAPRH